MESKACHHCKEVKPLGEFYRNKSRPDGRSGYCRPCDREAQQRNLDKHGHVYKARSSEYSRRRLYGLEPSDIVAMVEAQQGLCPICRDALPERSHVDHCHASGRVRGLLCGACNTGIGKFGEDPARIRAAIAYVEAHA